jgi:hypothetical protein
MAGQVAMPAEAAPKHSHLEFLFPVLDKQAKLIKNTSYKLILRIT